MALAMKREQTAYSSLLMLAGALLVDPEPIPLRLSGNVLIRGSVLRRPPSAHFSLKSVDL